MSTSSNPSLAPDAAEQQTSAGSVQPFDRLADLKLHLREAIAEPTNLIKQGTAPPPYFFAFEPSGVGEEQEQKFTALLGAAALGRILAGMKLVQSSPDHGGGGGAKGDEPGAAQHYSLENPHEYVAAFNEKTEAVIDAFTNGPLASMYGQNDGGAASKMELKITRAELHTVVLSHIFDGLSQVSKTHLADLDKVLSRFSAALQPFKVFSGPQGGQDGQDGKDGKIADDKGGDSLPELKLAVVIQYVKSVDITGGSGGIYVYQAYTRIVVFSVKPQHWALAIQKPPASKPKTSASEKAEAVAPGAADDHHIAAASSTSNVGAMSWPGWLGGKPKPPKPEDRITFALNTTVLELQFDDAKYHANKAKFENIFRGLAEKDEELDPIAKDGGLETLGRSTCTIYQAGEV
ncbi:hypothetical protein CSUB01_07316 [Colletotrichum sublineola]|uniref:Uncharacterized protein n=1 Tax=Colletotrichum sublineola TaxID=1173701 RepID=A0A066WW75_COLSU|nr:hypothetical protein CSUB01_07316 [Colletotrichum sublineola]